jgi:hypothetical protein
MSSPPQMAFRPTYVGWLIALLAVIVCFLGFLGVVPGDAKTFFGLIGVVALAIFFR